MEAGGDAAGGAALPPFLGKTYDMVDEPSSDAVVSWSTGGISFVVWDPLALARDLLPKYFKHSNFSSFVRQLNTYGFHKIDHEQWEFANEDFVKGKRHLLRNIHRRKPIFSHSAQPQNQGASPSAEAERRELEENIQKLKFEKKSLQLELQLQEEKKQEVNQRVQSLEDRLQTLENRQSYLITNVSQMINRLGVFSSFIPSVGEMVHGPGGFPNFAPLPCDNLKKRRLLGAIISNEDDAHSGDNQIVCLPSSSNERSGTPIVQVLESEPFDKLESSLKSLENLFYGASRDISNGGVPFDGFLSGATAPSDVHITELHASPGKSDQNLGSPVSRMQISISGEFDSSPEIAESVSHAESLSPWKPQGPQPGGQSKLTEIDVNAVPAEVGVAKDDIATVADPVVPANDGFWQQFLTELPGSTETQEVQSARRDEHRHEEQGNFVAA